MACVIFETFCSLHYVLSPNTPPGVARFLLTVLSLLFCHYCRDELREYIKTQSLAKLGSDRDKLTEMEVCCCIIIPEPFEKATTPFSVLTLSVFKQLKLLF